MKDKATKKVCLGVHITKDMHDKLVKMASEKELTISVLVRIAIKELLSEKAD
jgi:hypothetical protein